MATKPDPLGAKDPATEYQLRGRPKANKRRAKTVAGVIVTTILVVSALTSLLRNDPETDRLPTDRQEPGISDGPGPAGNRSIVMVGR